MADNTDVLLIQRVQEGSEEAFNELYEKYYRLVYFIAYEMCRNDADAKDILQDTFVQVKHSISTLQDRENFKPWLNRIVINKCKNMFRSKRTIEIDNDDLWYQHINEDRKYMLPEANMHMKSDQEIVHELLAQLSEQQREVLIMRYFEHMSMKEMAEILGVPEGTVKTRLMYGKNHLKKLIEAYEAQTGTKINFHVEDAALFFLFAYMFEHMENPAKWKAKKSTMGRRFEDGLWIGAIIALSSIMIVSGTMAFQTLYGQEEKGATDDQKANITLVKKSNAREYYYYLMDWACCKDDMLAKSKEDFDVIMPIYRSMLHTESEYLERLKNDHWIDDFEEIYNQF